MHFLFFYNEMEPYKTYVVDYLQPHLVGLLNDR